MPRRLIFSGSKYEELAGYARAVVVDDRIFVSGTVGYDFKTGRLPRTAQQQTKQALDTIEAALHEAESRLADVVRVRVFVPDPADVVPVSVTLKARLGNTRPANTTVCSPLAVPECKVEIEVEAIRGSANDLARASSIRSRQGARRPARSSRSAPARASSARSRTR